MSFATLFLTTLVVFVAAASVTVSSTSSTPLSVSLLRNKKQTAAPPTTGQFTLIYATSWPTTYLHYNADNTGWNTIPGVKMHCPTINASQYPCGANGYAQTTVFGDSVVFVLTDGSGQWDNNGGRNYDADHAGVWTLKGGKLTLVRQFPDGCPTAVAQKVCSGHGTCDTQSYQCHCVNANWCGPACAKNCSCGTCGVNAHCDHTDYECVCDAGWGKCSNKKQCTTNTNTSLDNCGACGNKCAKNGGAHVLSVACVAGKCHATCAAGYLACDDGTCAKSCPLPGCSTYPPFYACTGNQTAALPKFAANNWQTPARGTPGWRPSYQDYSRLKAYVTYRYAADHQSVTLIAKTFTKDPAVTTRCSFAGAPLGPCQAKFAAPQRGPITLEIQGSDGSKMIHDPIDFIWDAPVINDTARAGGDYRGGQKGSIVELFMWPHADIEKECAFLSKAGYLGAKLYPPTESLMSSEPMQNIFNPWWGTYQPVSNRLQGRMGTRDQLRAMIRKCRSMNVRIYIDSVQNAKTGNGNDANCHRNDAGGHCARWPMKNTSADFPPSAVGRVNGSSPFYTPGYTYEPMAQTGLPPMPENPAAALGPEDFHCERALNSWTSPLDLNYGWLVGLVDQATERDHVREVIAAFWTDLLSIGASGLRFDAAKHVKPTDHAAIYAKLKRNMGGNIPGDFLVYMEVLTGGEGAMLVGDPTSDYSYSVGLVNAMKAAGLTDADIQKYRLWCSYYPKQPGLDNGNVAMTRKVIENDDSDQQQTGSSSRDMQSYGTVLVIAKDIPLHRHFEVKLFQSPRGASDNDNDYPIRLVLSSYWLPQDVQGGYGVPDGLSDCSICTVNCASCDPAKSMKKQQAYRKGSTGYDDPYMPGHYTRVHRDITIVNAMRAWVHLPPLSEQDVEDL